ncbi:MAG: methanol/ethanol family PQQ-dependent dehydrogenase [Gammaproteobacteria bacterium]|nr:methanol/ethanol family PQQ-dependent dehydrogenase [Gammaproteobacteria bacterium]
MNIKLACRIVFSLVVLGALPAVGLSQGVEDYSPVSSQRLLNPEPENWLLYRRTYDGMGFSPLDQINVQNVADLVPVWTFATGITEGHQSPPIVNDGVMFITTPGAQVIALDARTGEQLWRYRRQLPFDLMQSHPTNRGVALYEDKVYVATVDAFVVALDARTGEVVWETAVEDYQRGYYMTLAPLVVAGNVMVGVSGGELGIRGFVTALNAYNGEEVWKTYTIPAPGEFGNDTWPGDSWQTGGAPVWLTGTFDPGTNLSFWGTGNPGPWIGDQRAGDNLYTNSVLALDVTTGELKGYHQYHWNGSWDWDEVTAPMLLDLERDGETVKSLVHAGRNGYIWVLEPSADGIEFVDAWPYVYQDVFTSIDPQTGRPTYDPDKTPGTGKPATYCPSLSGGNNWPPAAYSPQTGFLYIPANENLCTTLEGEEEVIYRPGQRYMGVEIDLNVRDGADHIGELQAWDLSTGERAWTHEYELNNWGPVLATAGGLLFTGGTPDRYFRAFDATTGEVLWQQRTSSGVTGIPSTYSVDGVQYVAVQSGWGVDAQRMLGRIDADLGITTAVPQGGALWVFALR